MDLNISFKVTFGKHCTILAETESQSEKRISDILNNAGNLFFVKGVIIIAARLGYLALAPALLLPASAHQGNFSLT